MVTKSSAKEAERAQESEQARVIALARFFITKYFSS